jgi:hypothetical protein
MTLMVNRPHAAVRLLAPPRVDVRIGGRPTAGGISNGFGTDGANTGDRTDGTEMREPQRRRGWLDYPQRRLPTALEASESDGNWRNG